MVSLRETFAEILRRNENLSVPLWPHVLKPTNHILLQHYYGGPCLYYASLSGPCIHVGSSTTSSVRRVYDKMAKSSLPMPDSLR